MTTEIKILIKILGEQDLDVLSKVADGVFDDPLDPVATATFLADPRHHLAVAIEDGVVIGFASAVHYVHPDKPLPEMWINEVGVAPTHQGRGTGKAILRALLERGRELRCTEAWLLTDKLNLRAMKLYSSLDGIEGPSDTVMFTFRLS